MRKKLLIACLVIFVIVVVFSAVVAMQPDHFRIERSIAIAAPPAEAFPHVNDLHHWEAWSPWAKLDPASTTSFEGPASGKGAIFKWSGNDEVGEGIMTITESRPDELVQIQLEFIKPFAGSNTTEFTFTPKGEETVVTWSMYGPSSFLHKAICMFMNMDQMLGAQFEKGLASMKAEVEAAQKKKLEEQPDAKSETKKAATEH